MSYQPAPYYLVVLQGPGPGTAHTLQGQMVTIGRQADNDVVVNDHRVSRHHGQLTWRSTTYLLEDLGSANGTWVNNARITAPVTLQPGDVIGLSQNVQLLYSDQPDASDRTYNLPPQAVAQPSPAQAAAPGAPVARPPAAPATPPSGGGQSVMAFGVGGLIALLGALALVVVAVGVYLITKSSSPSATVASVSPIAEVAPAETPELTPTPYPTYTPYPTFTSIPTEAATATPYPTYTPYPTAEPSVTPYPTYTPYPTSIATATPYPTYTPPPPPPPAPPKPKALPTDTPKPPTATPKPPFTVRLGSNRVYEPWGRPMNPDGCSDPDDDFPVRHFTLQLLVTNNSNSYTKDKWLPTFISASGAPLATCIFYYKNTVIEPGEMVDVTFHTNVEHGDYVKALVLSLLGHTVTICMDPGANEIPCK